MGTNTSEVVESKRSDDEQRSIAAAIQSRLEGLNDADALSACLTELRRLARAMCIEERAELHSAIGLAGDFGEAVHKRSQCLRATLDAHDALSHIEWQRAKLEPAPAGMPEARAYELALDAAVSACHGLWHSFAVEFVEAAVLLDVIAVAFAAAARAPIAEH